MGKIRVKILIKFLRLRSLCIERNRMLTSWEIMEEIGCSKSHSYNYLRALKKLGF